MYLVPRVPGFISRSTATRRGGGKCRGTELNRRRRPFQGRALPTELPRHDELIESSGLQVPMQRRQRTWQENGTTLNLGDADLALIALDVPFGPVLGSVATNPNFTGQSFRHDV